MSTFVVRSGVRSAECPHCGAALTDSGAPAREGGVTATLELARQMLEMDVAILSEIGAEHETAVAAAGRWPGVPSLVGASIPIERSFCELMLEGRIGNLIRDARGDPRVAERQRANGLDIGAWMGVPIEGEYARLYVLCCLAREARPMLAERDVFVLRALADKVAAGLPAVPAAEAN